MFNTCYKYIVFILMVIVVVSCIKNDFDIEFEYYPDVYVQKKIDQGDTVYAPFYVLYANMKVSEAEVLSPVSKIKKELITNDFYTYFLIPDAGDFITNFPETGEYKFTFTREEQEYTAIDRLDDNELDFPEMTFFAYDTIIKHSILVTWNDVPNADLYQVKLLDKDNVNIFNGNVLDKIYTKFNLDLFDTDLGNILKKGDMYTLQLHAYCIEENVKENPSLNVQCDVFVEQLFEYDSDTIRYVN